VQHIWYWSVFSCLLKSNKLSRGAARCTRVELSEEATIRPATYVQARVYLDAVFQPLVLRDEMIFKQEAWHYELRNSSDPSSLSAVGVVLNEMKGYYSDPLAWMRHELAAALYPDTSYGRHSGGRPLDILRLTHDELVRYHAEHYHPGNARVWFFGDAPEAERLAMVSEALGRLGDPPARGPSPLKPQPPPAAPSEVAGHYPGHPAGGAMAAVGWALGGGDGGLPEEDVVPMQVLSSLLVGTSTAPLLARLRESGLGSPITGEMGLDADNMQPSFVAGLRNVAEADVGKVHELILRVMAEVAEAPSVLGDAEAAINRMVVSYKAQAAESGSWGVDLAMSIAGPWVWGRDLFGQFSALRRVERMRERLGRGEDVFGDLARRYFLENPHRVNITMLPSEELAEQIAAEESRVLRAAYSSFASEGRVAELAEETVAIAAFQAEQDPPSAVATIPRLKISDLDTEVTAVPTEELRLGTSATRVLLHPQPTAGILYLRLALDLQAVSDDRLLLAPLLARLLLELGTLERSPAELNRDIGLATGGLTATVEVLTDAESPAEPLVFLLLEGKAMSGRAPELAQLIREVVGAPGLLRNDSGATALRQARSMASDLEASMLSSGIGPAIRRALGMLDGKGWAQEQLWGLSQLEALRGVLERLSRGGWGSVRDELLSLLRTATRRPAVVSVTGAEEVIDLARPHAEGLRSWLDALLRRDGPVPPRAARPRLPQRREAISLVSGSNHVASGADLGPGYSFSGASVAASNLLDTWLYKELRARRGAYGAHSFVARSGAVLLYTFRDPGLLATYEQFRRAHEFLTGFAAQPDAEELRAAAIKATNDVDPYMPPAERGRQALLWELGNVTEAQRREWRAGAMHASPSDVGRLGSAMAQAALGLVAATATTNATDSAGRKLFDAVLSVTG